MDTLTISIQPNWVSIILMGAQDAVESFSAIPENEAEEDRETREYDLKRSQQLLEYISRLDEQLNKQ